MNDKVQNYIIAVGALAESVALFYKELISNGLPQNAAEKAAQTFIIATLAPEQKGRIEDGQA